MEVVVIGIDHGVRGGLGEGIAVSGFGIVGGDK